MAMENKNNNVNNEAELPADSEFFVGDVNETPSERELFAGNDDLYSFLADYANHKQTHSHKPIADSQKTDFLPTKVKRFSNLQLSLAAAIIAIAALLFYTIFKSPSVTITTASSEPPMQNNIEKSPDSFAPVPKPNLTEKQQAEKTIPLIAQESDSEQPLSLKVAQDFYQNSEYKKAYDVYEQLRKNLSLGRQEQLLSDFLLLKMGLCMRKASAVLEQNPDENNALLADTLLIKAQKSRSPVVKVIANYYLSLAELQKKQFLQARKRAYITLALIDAVDMERELALSIKCDCHFIIAECLTRSVLTLADIDKDVPDSLWRAFGEPEPFDKLDETQLRKLLSAGMQQLNTSVLAPGIQKIDSDELAFRFRVICSGASVDELLARFSANAGFDIHWMLNGSGYQKKSSDIIRQRPVTLYMADAAPTQVITTAAGSVGLLARLTDQNDTHAVDVFSLDEYNTLSEQISLLAIDSVALWRSFLLAFHDDVRIPNVHFTLGILYAQQGNISEAIGEYKLVANRFPDSYVAPFALLNSSKIKTNLHDYFGAREDLSQLVEQYPDADISGQAYLYLAQVTMNAKLYDEAQILFRKVYSLAASNETKSKAAFGAAKCFYRSKKLKETKKWLNRYIELAKNDKSAELDSAYLLLGKTNLDLGDHEQAAIAFDYALNGKLAPKEYFETVIAFVKVNMNMQDYIGALNILENTTLIGLSQQQTLELLLLKTNILRKLGLIDKALSNLAGRVDYIHDSNIKAKITFEISKCHIDKENLDLAEEQLAHILTFVEPGDLAQNIAYELALVCWKMKNDWQTVSVCEQILQTNPSEDMKQKTIKLLARAHERLNNYDKAALVLVGQCQSKYPLNENLKK